MLRNFTSRVFGIHVRQYSSSTSPASEKWALVSSICVQRKPIIVKEMSKFEKEVQTTLMQMEQENSLKSDWELQIDDEKSKLEEIKGGDSSNVGLKLRKDWEDEWKAEFTNFKLEPCITEADRKKDVKSWYRSLDSTLILVVQQEDCGNRWILPNGIRSEGETMRQAAERIIKESCGEDLKVQFYGNAPCGFYKYKYPRSHRDKTGVQGEKVFFYKAYLRGGSLKSSPIVKDFKWVQQSELSSMLPKDYCKSVEQFLLGSN